MDAEEIHEAPDQMVPRRLYLPDGRMVPTCVVYAPPLPVVDDEQAPLTLSFPSDLFGGGYVCLTEVQGRRRVGTIACMVTDGVRTYALTNRHVAGFPDRRSPASSEASRFPSVSRQVGPSDALRSSTPTPVSPRAGPRSPSTRV